VAEAAVGLGGLPPRPKNTMEPPLAAPSFWRRKDEEEGEEEERKKNQPPLKISGFATADSDRSKQRTSISNYVNR